MPFGWCYTTVNANVECRSVVTAPQPFDFDALFRGEYARLTRALARIVRDHARAEELAVDAFLRLRREPKAQGDHSAAWLHVTGVRLALNALRREGRRERYERLFGRIWPVRHPRDPEGVHLQAEEQRRVRTVLAALPRRQAELLILRHDGFTYRELIEAVGLHPASVGTYLARAERAFRREFIRRYGEPHNVTR
jgi:RNA polymerase sigma-70 factor (ECF subfamily)